MYTKLLRPFDNKGVKHRIQKEKTSLCEFLKASHASRVCVQSVVLL